MSDIRRRKFITLIGGAAAWPLAARAQQGERMPRIGVLMAVAADTEGQARMAALLQGLQQLGWTDGQIDTRWGAGDAARPICLSNSHPSSNWSSTSKQPARSA
jgi:putative ABC transport system substrate-binding protein